MWWGCQRGVSGNLCADITLHRRLLWSLGSFARACYLCLPSSRLRPERYISLNFCTFTLLKLHFLHLRCRVYRILTTRSWPRDFLTSWPHGFVLKKGSTRLRRRLIIILPAAPVLPLWNFWTLLSVLDNTLIVLIKVRYYIWHFKCVLVRSM